MLNGPPASGKSTLARMYVADHPLALNLDIDRIRALLGDWRNHPTDAGLRARALSIAAARVQLFENGDVVVPQFLGKPDFLDQLQTLAAETRAEYHELVLLPDREEAVRRFEHRTRTSSDPADREAAEMIAHDPTYLHTAHEALTTLLTTRPQARLIPTTPNNPIATYQALLTTLT